MTVDLAKRPAFYACLLCVCRLFISTGDCQTKSANPSSSQLTHAGDIIDASQSAQELFSELSDNNERLQGIEAQAHYVHLDKRPIGMPLTGRPPGESSAVAGDGVPTRHEGEFGIAFDKNAYRRIIYSPDNSVNEIWTYRDGYWWHYGARRKALERRLPDQVAGALPLDPRMWFMFDARAATIEEFRRLYSPLAAGTEDSLSWIDFATPFGGVGRPTAAGRLRIWIDKNGPGLPIKSQQFRAAGHLESASELDYEFLQDRSAWLLKSAIVRQYFDSTVENPPLDSWKEENRISLADVSLLDSDGLAKAFRPEKEIVGIKRSADITNRAPIAELQPTPDPDVRQATAPRYLVAIIAGNVLVVIGLTVMYLRSRRRSA